MTVLFLGSGFSWVMGGVPIQENFLPYLFRTNREWLDDCGAAIGKDRIKLSRWFESVGDIELCMSHLHNLAYSNLRTIESKKWAKKAIINLRGLISNRLNGIPLRPLEATRFRCWVRQRENVVIVTTNYDCLIEEILGYGTFCYPTISTVGERKIPLYKLHGSINWMERRKLRDGELVRWQHPPVICEWGWKLPPPLCRNGFWVFPSGNGGTEIYTSILIPFFFQKEEWLEKQETARWAPIFEKHWNVARAKCLSKGISEFYFIGYGLPPADHYMMSWLLDIFGEAKPKKITIISKGDPGKLSRVLSPFHPKIYKCGLEHFLEGHANL